MNNKIINFLRNGVIPISPNIFTSLNTQLKLLEHIDGPVVMLPFNFRCLAMLGLSSSTSPETFCVNTRERLKKWHIFSGVEKHAEAEKANRVKKTRAATITVVGALD